jgi:hypothetical protein
MTSKSRISLEGDSWRAAAHDARGPHLALNMPLMFNADLSQLAAS